MLKKEYQKKNPYLPTLFLRQVTLTTPIYIFWPNEDQSGQTNFEEFIKGKTEREGRDWKRAPSLPQEWKEMKRR